MEIGLSIVFVLACYVIWSDVTERLKNKRQANLMKYGIESEALVLVIISSRKELKQGIAQIQLQVFPGNSRNFVTELEAKIADIEAMGIQPGKRILIKYLAKNERKVVFIKML